MSRFVEILEAQEREITVDTFQQMVREMVEKLEAEEGSVEMTFPYFIEKKAAVSGVKSLLDYEVTFTSQIRKKKQCFQMKVVVPVTSLCPCSKKISERGAHNQRSHVTITAQTNAFVWIEELVDLAHHAQPLRCVILSFGATEPQHGEQPGSQRPRLFLSIRA
jgi:GTP cyclohydrolase I